MSQTPALAAFLERGYPDEGRLNYHVPIKTPEQLKEESLKRYRELVLRTKDIWPKDNQRRSYSELFNLRDLLFLTLGLDGLAHSDICNNLPDEKLSELSNLLRESDPEITLAQGDSIDRLDLIESFKTLMEKWIPLKDRSDRGKRLGQKIASLLSPGKVK